MASARGPNPTLPMISGRTGMNFENSDFVKLVKRTRETLGVGIEEAHDMIFADAEMRRLVAWRVNRDPMCRKQALWEMRQKGERSRFVLVEGQIRFREDATRFG
jgi:hypothetical protein